TFRRITLPAIKWAVVYGVVLSLARLLGEVGAVKVVSANVLGQTRTATLVVEEKYLYFDQQGAYATAFLLAMVSVACIVIVAIIRPKEERRCGGKGCPREHRDQRRQQVVRRLRRPPGRRPHHPQ